MQAPPLQTINAISAQETALVLVDYQTAFASCFSNCDLTRVEAGLVELCRAGIALGVPLIASLVETNLVRAKLPQNIEGLISEAERFLRSGANPWEDTAFASAVKTASRPKLLLAGLSAETSLTFAALSALEQGYDVYLIKDVCLARSSDSLVTAFERLVQAGCVPVSWRQVVIEWNQKDVDLALLRRIMKMRTSSTTKAQLPE